MQNVRIERDFLGEKAIDADAYYGIQTARALENFNITGLPISKFPSLLTALAQLKKACAQTNHQLGNLPKNKTKAIAQACDEIIQGSLHEHFVVDVIQGGAGTSTNMNANEVIANRALEILGYDKGDYNQLHPNNDVNMSQSTNDIYPTAFRIALYDQILLLESALQCLKDGLEQKALEFKDVVKMGRTQLQDAVPMTLGQEFQSFASLLDADLKAIRRAKFDANKMNLGGTAIGTGINAPSKYKTLVFENLSTITQREFVPAEDLIAATQDTSVFVHISGLLKRVAVKLSKMCNDLRLLSSGPRTGFNEINLPPMQPGSSIMPGKVNPVIPEVVNQVAFDVIGADTSITLASEAGQLQLNVFEPLIMFKLFQSLDMLSKASLTLQEKCILGITANVQHCQNLVEGSIGIVTALSPKLGYATCSELAKLALKSGKSIKELVLEKELMTQAELDVLLDTKKMIG